MESDAQPCEQQSCEQVPCNQPRGKQSGNSSKLTGDPRLTDRARYATPIGPVCMSRAEHDAYIEELEERAELTELLRDA